MDISKKEAYEQALREDNISLVLSSYNDLFSSFDPRPYGKKALSDDFLIECKKASRDKEKGVELRFLISKEKRHVEQEAMIKKRLKEHFQRHKDLLEKERKSIIKQGIFFLLFGVIFMVLATCILFYKAKSNLAYNFFVVFLEPGGWFLFWEGLNLIIFESKKVSPDLEFYRKMASSEVSFLNY